MKKQIANQFRKPSGLWGRVVARLMRKMNRPYYEKLIQKLNIIDSDKILEIGYGPGDSLKIIGELNYNCKIAGIDFSELMYKKAAVRNTSLINSGRLDLQFGDFLTYDFDSKKFSKIFCVNVIYFWNDLSVAFKKVFNLLEEKGVYSIYMSSADDLMKIPFARTDIFNKYSIDHVKSNLLSVGFKDVKYDSFLGKEEHGYFIFAEK